MVASYCIMRQRFYVFILVDSLLIVYGRLFGVIFIFYLFIAYTLAP